ncbi:sensor histidine kinase [Dactylosporangium sp. CA-139066]|uniref:sensor histidine kinase n=1 Tax=Dactylosporangium sp. CA-139066 TaxID=3239930 RepID=UPI003D89CD4F
MTGTTFGERLRRSRAALRRDAVTPPARSRWAFVTDTVLAVGLAVGAFGGFAGRVQGQVTMTSTGAPIPPPPARLPDDIPYFGAMPWQQAVLWGLLTALATLPLAVRRRYPLTVFWIVGLASQTYHLAPGFDPTFTFAACVIAAYGAVMYSPYRIPAIVSVAAGGLPFVLHRANLPVGRPGLILLLLLIPVGLAANAVHTMQQRVRQAETQREAEATLAVQRERARIAQELHDVVTHNVSVMVVQAAAARRVLPTAPDKVEQALAAIESGGRAAMSELRHVMGLLSMSGDEPDQDGPEDLLPAPGLDRLPELVERVRAAGTQVDVTVGGTPGPLPPGIDLTAYRIVQEALTNTVKHATGARVRIVVEHQPAALRIAITDTGGAAGPSAPAGNGRGLIGLRERLAVYGGTLHNGHLPAGGYEVLATIPLEPA